MQPPRTLLLTASEEAEQRIGGEKRWKTGLSKKKRKGGVFLKLSCPLFLIASQLELALAYIIKKKDVKVPEGKIILLGYLHRSSVHCTAAVGNATP